MNPAAAGALGVVSAGAFVGTKLPVEADGEGFGALQAANTDMVTITAAMTAIPVSGDVPRIAAEHSRLPLSSSSTAWRRRDLDVEQPRRGVGDQDLEDAMDVGLERIPGAVALLG